MLESSPNDLSRVLSDQATVAQTAHARFPTLLDGWLPGTLRFGAADRAHHPPLRQAGIRGPRARTSSGCTVR